MATERLGSVLERVAPVWGVEPLPDRARRFSGPDLAVLWGDLSVGLLVLVTGAFLVPALGLPAALGAIALGSVIGCLPLALVGVAGAREGVPTMVLLRPLLGRAGSIAPSVLNLLQLLGWTAFEFWAMGRVANAVSIRLFGFDSYPLWLGVVAVVCTALALGGPVLVVRRWLERFGVHAVLAALGWITYRVLSAGDLGALLSRPGEGGLPFWVAVDLVVVMPISWLPLVADYNRFARAGARGGAGTYWGYLVGNVWLYALGALLVLQAAASPDVVGIGDAITSLAGGSVVLLVLLAGESDQAFANIYSSAVSVQNVFPRASQRALIVAVAAAGVALALGLSMDRYEVFLFLIGSVFVPLAATFLAHYFVVRRGGYERVELTSGSVGVRWPALLPWLGGFVVYHWSVPTGPAWWLSGLETALSDWLRLDVPLFGGRFGATLPSFAVAFALSLIVLRRD
jgi:putative hydroxymethylpyrimidine transporter CytX